MENASLLKKSRLDSERIDYGSYTTTLVQEAYRVGLLDDRAMETIQNQLLSLLRAQIQGSTHGESTSIPAEKADSLMDGIGYCIDLALKNAPSVEASTALLQTKSMAELYKDGTAWLESHARACRSLLARVRATQMDTVNAGYQIVLDTTFPQLLREYEANPHPHDFAVITEYPLAVEYKQDGIPGVHARLAALALENRFCARYADGLERLLRDYARQNCVSPVDAYVNLFTIALQNLLLNRLLRRDGLFLSSEDISDLQTRLAPLTDELRSQLFGRAAAELLAACHFENERLDAYVLEAARIFAASIGSANLETLAVVSHDENVPVHLDGERLDDDTFREIADELFLCDTANRKIQILRDHIHSLSDLCDLFSADCFFEGELQEVFSSWGAAECALLLTRIPFAVENGKLAAHEEIEWHLKYIRFLNELASERLREILQIYQTLPPSNIENT